MAVDPPYLGLNSRSSVFRSNLLKKVLMDGGTLLNDHNTSQSNLGISHVINPNIH